MASTNGTARGPDIIRRFEHAIVLVLLGLLMVVVSLSTLELAWRLFKDLASEDVLVLEITELFELFGYFLLVLIGMELLSTLRSYLYERVIHSEVVLEVALIAIAQKIIILDVSRAGGLTLLGLAGVIVALAAAFWTMRWSRRTAIPSPPDHR